MRIENRSFTLTEVKLADDGAASGTFEGYGAVFGNVDAYGDVIAKGAFAGSLREAKARGKFPPMLLQHGGGMFGGWRDGHAARGQVGPHGRESEGPARRGQAFCARH